MGGISAVNVFEAISTRRDVRQYTDQPIKPDDLDQILEAGRRSPSSSNDQRWDFVVVTDRRELQDLATVWQHAQHVARSAATVVLVAPEPADDEARQSTYYDLGQATMCMMLAAVELGIGSAHARVADQDRARELLGFPRDHTAPWLITFGYPADRPLRVVRHPQRRPFEDVVHRGRW
jgi:nitroreductase